MLAGPDYHARRERPTAPAESLSGDRSTLERVRGSFSLSTLLLAGACVSTPSAGADAPAWRFLHARYDRDRDGRIEREEYPRSADAFQRLDADGDGVVSAADFDPRWDGVPRIAAAGGEAEDRWIGFQDFVHGEGGPEVGEPAPPFRLVATSGEELELAAFRDERPVVLVFGSYT